MLVTSVHFRRERYSFPPTVNPHQRPYSDCYLSPFCSMSWGCQPREMNLNESTRVNKELSETIGVLRFAHLQLAFLVQMPDVWDPDIRQAKHADMRQCLPKGRQHISSQHIIWDFQILHHPQLLSERPKTSISLVSPVPPTQSCQTTLIPTIASIHPTSTLR